MRHLGYYPDTERILQEHAIDVVVLSDLDAERERIVELANLCEKEMVQFKVIPSYFQILVSGLHLENVNGVPMLGVSQPPAGSPLQRHRQAARRYRRRGGGPRPLRSAHRRARLAGASGIARPRPSSSQERIGQNGRRFSMYKIRSMRLGAEKSDHLRQSTRGRMTGC